MFEESRTGAGGTTQLTNTLAAVFATEHDARAAIKDLHKAGFKKTWLGKMLPDDRKTGEPAVEEAGGQMLRFFSGDPTKKPLHKALLEQGVSESQASELEQDVAPGCAVLTVYGEDNPSKARDVLVANKGDVFDAEASPTAVRYASANPRTGRDGDDRDTDRADGDVARSGLLAEDRTGDRRDDGNRSIDQAPYDDDTLREHTVEEFYEYRPSSR
jgi:hypothetical protein